MYSSFSNEELLNEFYLFCPRRTFVSPEDVVAQKVLSVFTSIFYVQILLYSLRFSNQNVGIFHSDCCSEEKSEGNTFPACRAPGKGTFVPLKNYLT